MRIARIELSSRFAVRSGRPRFIDAEASGRHGAVGASRLLFTGGPTPIASSTTSQRPASQDRIHDSSERSRAEDERGHAKPALGWKAAADRMPCWYYLVPAPLYLCKLLPNVRACCGQDQTTFETQTRLWSRLRSGVGIGEKDKDRIFEPFFSTKSTGTGIGLTICQSIIESHGGGLRASANIPYGATFEIVLPIEAAA